jgi:ABC-type dipeptide/oligopeptide/nickel transport system permease component
MGMVSFVVRRLLLIIPVLLGVTLLTFLISHVVVKNPVIAWAGPRASPQTYAAIAAQYHLNSPLYIQYWYYIIGLISGNWGVSPTTHTPVLQDIATYFPATIELSVVALVISVVIGIPMGVLSAILNGRKLDYPVRLLYLSGVASPPFLLALIAQLVFSYYFHLLPSSGRLSPNVQPPVHITGMYLLDSALTGNWPVFLDALRHIILPATALALLTFAIIARVTRSSVLETMNKDFVRTAKAKGLPYRQIIFRHTLRNALVSTVTVIGLAVQFVLFGTIVIETIFFWPGIGLYATDSILNLDFPAIMGVTVIFTLVVVFTNLVTDISYAFLDPSVRLE